MNTKVNVMTELNLNKEAINQAAEIIRRGGLVAFPTETVYGLGANALDKVAVEKIFLAKGRPQDNPLIVHVASREIKQYVKEIPEIATKLMKQFWPGPLTIILPKNDCIPDATSAGLSTIGIRMPKNNIALELIKTAGVPIAAPSANLSGKPSPTTASRVIEDLNGKIDFILGGDNSEYGLESTIIDCTLNPPCILRPGGITLEMLREVEQSIYLDPGVMNKFDSHAKPKAPGMKYRHYAPKAPVTIVQGELNKIIHKINEISLQYKKEQVGIICTDETRDLYHNGIVLSVGSRNDLSSVGHNLFEFLRKLDDFGVEFILSESFEESGLGIAIMNRLKKAASFDVIHV